MIDHLNTKTTYFQSNPDTLAKCSDLMNKVNRVFWAGLGCLSVYNLIDSGLANVLALETLTHGTGPLGYMGITINGADPNYGGGSTGSSVGMGSVDFIESSKKFFHVFKDSHFSKNCRYHPRDLECQWYAKKIIHNFLPRTHAVLSGMASFGYTIKDGYQNSAQGAIGAISGFLTPTLKFRFTPEEILNCRDACRFENDSNYDGMAYKTSKAISASHLGIVGSFSQGINSGMFNRMAANPEKVLLGIALLGVAALVAKATYRYINSEQQTEPVIPPPASNPTSEPTRYFQNTPRTLKVLAVNSCRATLILTIIFLNTL